MKNLLLVGAIFISAMVFVACNDNDNKYQSKKGPTIDISIKDIVGKLKIDDKSVDEFKLTLKKQKLEKELEDLETERTVIKTELTETVEKQGEAEVAAAEAQELAKAEIAKARLNGQFRSDIHTINEENSDLADVRLRVSELVADLNFLDHKIRYKTVEIKLVESQLGIIHNERVLNSGEFKDSETIRRLQEKISNFESDINELNFKLHADREVEEI